MSLAAMRWYRLLMPVGVTAIGLALLVPERPDRLGHFLAGFGATLAVAWLVALVTKGRPLAIVAACVACIGLGHLVEAHVFPLGGYDVIDFVAQSVGAAHAGFALVGGRAGDPVDDWFDLDGLTPSAYGRHVLATSAFAFLIGAWSAFR